MIFPHYALSIITIEVTIYFIISTLFKHLNFHKQNNILWRLFLVDLVFKISDKIYQFSNPSYTISDKIGDSLLYLCDLNYIIFPILLINSYKRKVNLSLLKYQYSVLLFPNLFAIINVGSSINVFLTYDEMKYYFSQQLYGFVEDGITYNFSQLEGQNSLLFIYNILLTHGFHIIISLLLYQRLNLTNHSPKKNLSKVIIGFFITYTYFHIQSLILNYILAFLRTEKIYSRYYYGDYVFSITPPALMIEILRFLFGDQIINLIYQLVSIPIIYSYFVSLIMYFAQFILGLLIYTIIYTHNNNRYNNNTFYKSYFKKDLIIYQ